MSLPQYGNKAWKNTRRPQSKFGNRIVKTDEGTFDSEAEHRRWCELKLLQLAGQISNLEHHKVFRFELNGVLIGSYEADFVYFENGARVCEDVKGVRTDVYRLKRQLMLAFYSINIRET